MKLLSAILVGLLFVWAVGLYCENQSLKTQADYVPSITEQLKAVQRQVGCVKIDAKVWGPESKGFLKPIIEKEEQKLCNQYAAQWDYIYKETK